MLYNKIVVRRIHPKRCANQLRGVKRITNLVRLLIIDKIHLLHDDRGPVLEDSSHAAHTSTSDLSGCQDVATFYALIPTRATSITSTSYYKAVATTIMIIAGVFKL
jgi:hypothetical protein